MTTVKRNVYFSSYSMVPVVQVGVVLDSEVVVVAAVEALTRYLAVGQEVMMGAASRTRQHLLYLQTSVV